MTQVIQLAARELLLEPLAALRVGDNRTESSAIHSVDFVGGLMPWPNFSRDVITTFSSASTHWSTHTLDVRIAGMGSRDSISVEQLVLGDETGLQGRLNERLGRPVTSSLQAQGVRLRMADFKASAPAATYRRVPDMVMLDDSSAIMVLGEAKCPWPKAHLNMLTEGLLDLDDGQEHKIRRLLGQVARYMRELNVKHAFLSTYDETVFLRKVDIQGVWTLQYSPVIKYDDSYNPQAQTITTRQGLFHIALLAQSDPLFTTSGGGGTSRRNQRWTVSRD